MRASSGPAAIARDLRQVRYAARGVLRFGSWALNVHSTSALLLDELAFLFRQASLQVTGAHPRRGAATLRILTGDAAAVAAPAVARALGDAAPIPADGFRETHSAGVTAFCTERVRVLIAGGRAPEICLVTTATSPDYELRVHLSLALNVVLFHFGRMLLHAGAVRIGDRVHLFIGERGAGKTSVCLRLAAAGATVLSDDHVVVRRRPRGFSVSGCSGHTRLTAETEAFFLARPLAVPAQDFAGVHKKEVEAAQLCRSRPFRDYRLGAVYFSRIGSRVSLRPLARHETLAELLRCWRGALRFAAPAQIARCLDFFAAVAAQVEGFELELSTRLSDLDQVAAWLSPTTRPGSLPGRPVAGSGAWR